MKKETYKLVGIFNMFDVIPDFVYPVFEREGKYFFQHANEEGHSINSPIEEFVQIKENAIEEIKFFKDFIVSGNQESDYHVGSKIVYVFQINKEHLQIGTEEEMIEFAITYKSDDDKVVKELSEFLKDAGIGEEKRKVKKVSGFFKQYFNKK